MLAAASLAWSAALIPAWILGLAILGTAVTLFAVHKHVLASLKNPSPVEAAIELDSALESKDRFTTFAAATTSDTEPEKSAVVGLVQEQLARFVPRFTAHQHLPIRLATPSKYSLACSPLPIAALLFVLLRREPHIDVQAVANSALPERVKDALQNLAEQSTTEKPNLPADVRDSLQDIADKLLESEELSSEVIDEVTKEIAAVDTEDC